MSTSIPTSINIQFTVQYLETCSTAKGTSNWNNTFTWFLKFQPPRTTGLSRYNSKRVTASMAAFRVTMFTCGAVSFGPSQLLSQDWNPQKFLVVFEQWTDHDLEYLMYITCISNVYQMRDKSHPNVSDSFGTRIHLLKLQLRTFLHHYWV